MKTKQNKKYKSIALVSSLTLVMLVVSGAAFSPGAWATLSGKPSAMTLGAESVTSNTAKLSGHVDANNTHDTVFWFEWGEDKHDLENQTPKKNVRRSKDAAFVVTDLEVDKSYYYRIVASNAEGKAVGSVRAFTTKEEGSGITPIAVTRNTATASFNFATLHGISISGGTPYTGVWFEWGTTLALLHKTDVQSLLSGQSREFVGTITSLSPGTTYYYRAVAMNKHGRTYGNVFSFTTPQLPGSGSSHKITSGQNNKNTSGGSKEGYKVSLSKRISSACESSCNLDMTTGKARSGAVVTFLINVKNTGNTPIVDAKVSNKVSPFLEFVNASDDGMFDKNEDTVYWKIGTLTPGAEKKVKVTMKTKRASKEVTATGIAMLSWNGKYGNGEKKSNSTKLTITKESAPVGGSINVENKTVRAGGLSHYTIIYENKTQKTINGVKFQISLPEGLLYTQKDGDTKLEMSGGSLVYTDQKLDPGSTKTISFHAKVDKDVKNDKTLTTTMIINYKNPLTGKQKTDNASVSTTVSGEVQEGGVSGFLSAAGAVPFFPNSLIEWLILFLVLIILVLILRQLYSVYVDKKRQKEAQADADRQMRDIQNRANFVQGPYGQTPQAPHIPEGYDPNHYAQIQRWRGGDLGGESPQNYPPNMPYPQQQVNGPVQNPQGGQAQPGQIPSSNGYGNPLPGGPEQMPAYGNPNFGGNVQNNGYYLPQNEGGYGGVMYPQGGQNPSYGNGIYQPQNPNQNGQSQNGGYPPQINPDLNQPNQMNGNGGEYQGNGNGNQNHNTPRNDGFQGGNLPH